MERTEIDAMRHIPLADFLARLGHEPVRRSGNELWYRAPYRNERTPSFRVNVAKQLWYDFGTGKGGDIFTLAGEFIGSNDFMEQVKFIAETANMPMPVSEMSKPTFLPKPSYAARGKRYFAVGFPNVAGGYEIRSRFFKGCVPPKDVSLVKAEGSPADVCSVFEGFMDFLSAATLGLETGDCLVLNSISNVEKAMRYLDGYGRIDCYLDRDEAGRRTLEMLKGHYEERVCDRSALYDGCKDLNEYLQLTTKKEQ